MLNREPCHVLGDIYSIKQIYKEWKVGIHGIITACFYGTVLLFSCRTGYLTQLLDTFFFHVTLDAYQYIE